MDKVGNKWLLLSHLSYSGPLYNSQVQEILQGERHQAQLSDKPSPRKEVYIMAMTNNNTQQRQGALNIGRGPQWNKNMEARHQKEEVQIQKDSSRGSSHGHPLQQQEHPVIQTYTSWWIFITGEQHYTGGGATCRSIEGMLRCLRADPLIYCTMEEEIY